MTVNVVGWQWWWEFKYPVNSGRDTVFTANEIHVPVGTPVARACDVCEGGRWLCA